MFHTGDGDRGKSYGLQPIKMSDKSSLNSFRASLERWMDMFAYAKVFYMTHCIMRPFPQQHLATHKGQIFIILDKINYV